LGEDKRSSGMKKELGKIKRVREGQKELRIEEMSWGMKKGVGE
jgi:hypothetical protein